MKPEIKALLRTRRVQVGLGLIYLAGLGYLAEVIIPFSGIQNKVETWVGVLVIAELFFIAGVIVMGKPVYKLLKHELLKRLRSNKSRQN
jgi:hypothetical protein